LVEPRFLLQSVGIELNLAHHIAIDCEDLTQGLPVFSEFADGIAHDRSDMPRLRHAGGTISQLTVEKFD